MVCKLRVNRILRSSVLAGAAILLAAPLGAEVDLLIHFSALKRTLAEAVFTQDGRRYVKGTKNSRCNFAYLENPEVGGDNGRLRVKARFTGRSALDVFGRCVGLGDAFNLNLLATPYYSDGCIALKDLRVDGSGRDGFYIRRVCAAMKRSLERDFRYPAAAEARRVTEASSTPAYRRELGRFNVTAIRVVSEGLLLNLDFALAVH